MPHKIDSAFTDDTGIGITHEFRQRREDLERWAYEFGCEPGSDRDLDIVAYRIALNLKLDGSWRHDPPEPGSYG